MRCKEKITNKLLKLIKKISNIQSPSLELEAGLSLKGRRICNKARFNIKKSVAIGKVYYTEGMANRNIRYLKKARKHLNKIIKCTKKINAAHTGWYND